MTRLYRSVDSISRSATHSLSLSALPIVRSSVPLSLNVFVDRDILSFLHMAKKERKTKFMVSPSLADSLASVHFRELIEKKLPQLSGKQYKLRCGLPGSKLPELVNVTNNEKVSDFIKLSESGGHSVIHVFVDRWPGVFPPSTNASYEHDCGPTADPVDTASYTMLSFFSFDKIAEPNEFAQQLQHLWSPFKAYGRVYIATEGVNAQMAVPTNVLEQFEKATKSITEFRQSLINTDHVVDFEEFHETQPFKSLHIRVREQILGDGLSPRSLDWHSAGQELSPTQWHSALSALPPDALVLDCRNSYESDVGKFEGAQPLNTNTFRESWNAIQEILGKQPQVSKDTPIYTYCTGGIRCVKINAYLEQKLGFTNTYRLQGGIISYVRELENGMKSSSISGPELSLPTTPNDHAAVSHHAAGDSDNIVTTTATKTDIHGQIDDSGSISSSLLRRHHAGLPDDVFTLSNHNNHHHASSSYHNRSLTAAAPSLFKGVNYVFDDRIGTRVTEDVLARGCECCGDSRWDMYINCRHDPCNVRFIQCPSCRERYKGCCSLYCTEQLDALENVQTGKLRKSVMNKHMIPRNKNPLNTVSVPVAISPKPTKRSTIHDGVLTGKRLPNHALQIDELEKYSNT
jgi:predicted sulfurtransferase